MTFILLKKMLIFIISYLSDFKKLLLYLYIIVFYFKYLLIKMNKQFLLYISSNNFLKSCKIIWNIWNIIQEWIPLNFVTIVQLCAKLFWFVLKFTFILLNVINRLLEFLRSVTFQILWPLDTKNCGCQRPRIAFLSF